LITVEGGKDLPADNRFYGLNEAFQFVESHFDLIERKSPDSSFESGFNATMNLLKDLHQDVLWERKAHKHSLVIFWEHPHQKLRL